MNKNISIGDIVTCYEDGTGEEYQILVQSIEKDKRFRTADNEIGLIYGGIDTKTGLYRNVGSDKVLETTNEIEFV